MQMANSYLVAQHLHLPGERFVALVRQQCSRGHLLGQYVRVRVVHHNELGDAVTGAAIASDDPLLRARPAAELMSEPEYCAR
mgnify:CR=1 FL=1